jgi:ankyrin repeat protein
MQCRGYIIMSPMDFDGLSKAIKKGDVVRVRRYLDSGGDADLSHKFGCTLLMCAAFEGNTAVGTELIRHGAQLNLLDKQGWTALSHAAHKRHPGFVELLCKSGASLDAGGSPFESFLDWTSEYGGTGSQETMAKIKSIVKATREARETEPPQPFA